MSREIREELRQRVGHAVVEAEAVFWQTVRKMFPEVQGEAALPEQVHAAMWAAFESTVRAWAIENVPGAIEAFARTKSDGANGMDEEGEDEVHDREDYG